MDCDNEELKATKHRNKKTADEMFKELGYIITDFKSDRHIEYSYKKRVMGEYFTHSIKFIFPIKLVIFEGIKGFGIQEFEAINKKVEELGWI